MENKQVIRLNEYLRIAMIIILLVIGGSILYFKFGYENPDDVQMNYFLNNITRSVTCRQALFYYAEHEWQLSFKNNYSVAIPDLNFSQFNLSE